MSESDAVDRGRQHSSRRAPLLAAVASLAVLGVGGAFIRLDETGRRNAERRSVTEIGLAQASEVEKQLERVYAAAYALSVTASGARSADFTAVAADILARFPGVGALELAPAGVVARVHPPSAIEGEQVGRDLLEDQDESPAALSARETGGFVVAGPFPRGRSGPVFFGYLPLQGPAADGAGFAGFAIAAVRVSDLVAASRLARLSERGYDYRLSRAEASSGRTLTFARSSELGLEAPVDLKLKVAGSDWTLSLAPRGGWRASPSLGRSIALVCVLSLLAGVFAYDVLSKPEVLRREVELRTRRLLSANRAVTSEVVRRERAERQLLHEASHDALTGLPNRAYFLSRIARALETCQREPARSFAVLLLGLDRFKSLNDSLGPGMGDRLLVATARRLEISLRPDDVGARVGGDEFAVLLADVSDVAAAAAVAQRVHEAVGRPISLGDQDVVTTAGIGIALSAEGYSLPEDVLRDADLALRRAKAEGGARNALFERSMHDRAVRLRTLESDLRRALERQELRVVYQPIVSLSSGQITSFEALVRWQHPEHGMIPPSDFIPLAESTGLVLPIDRWVWNEAARQIRGLHDRFPKGPAVSVSVNLSTRHLSQPDLVDQVAGALAQSGLAAPSLRLEITESMMLDDTVSAAGVLAELRGLDVRLVLDDFGTGYSSLSYLHELPIDVLKIDRSFVGRLGVEAKHSEIVRTIVDLGHGLGMDVIAEGVETEGQLARLRSLGCGYVQGFFFSRPVEGKALEPLIASAQRW